MAELIPSIIKEQETPSKAERVIFDWFKNDDIKGVVLHSLIQKNHQRKLIAEIDFLYISKRGILCFEVKGGAISRSAGRWYSVDKIGEKHEISNPFNQVKECSYALIDHLANVYGKNSVESSITVGYGVILPDCVFTGKGNDLVTEILFDCSKNLQDFPKYLDNCFNYWEDNLWQRMGLIYDNLSPELIKKLTNLLRGDFAVVPSMKLEIQNVEQQLLELTEEQYEVMEVINCNKRVIVSGGAGTGKTLLAIEKMRKALAENKKVAFVCFNKNIAKKVQASLEDVGPDSYIGTFHSLVGKYVEMNSTDWSGANDIANIFLQGNYQLETYDYLVVDEAQDLMAVAIWDSLAKFLKDGLAKGNWVFFMDPNQNLFNSTDDYDFALDYLKEAFSPAMVPLTINCRNTSQIAKVASYLSGLPAVKHLKAKGPEVSILAYRDKKQVLSLLETKISGLMKDGCKAKDIVILSKYRYANSELADEKSLCDLTINPAGDINLVSDNCLNYFTIQSFKGLEANVVFLIDVKGFNSEQNRVLNYVATTRAKVILIVCYNASAEAEYQALKGKAK